MSQMLENWKNGIKLRAKLVELSQWKDTLLDLEKQGALFQIIASYVHICYQLSNFSLGLILMAPAHSKGRG